MGKEVKEIEGVGIGKIKRMRNLSGTWNFFGYQTKQDFDRAGITDLQMAQYINGTGEVNKAAREAWEREQEEALENYKIDKAQYQEEVGDREERLRDRVEKKVTQYLGDFEAPTESDEDNLKNLAEAQLRLEGIHQDRRRQMSQPFAVRVSKASRDVLSDLASEEKALLQQIRLMQKGMGIDRPTREDKAAEVTGVDRVKAIVRKAKDFLEEEMEDMVCECGIRTAWVSDFFPETYFKVVKQCARCGKLMFEEAGNFEWYVEMECPVCSGKLVKKDNSVVCEDCKWQCIVGVDFVEVVDVP